MTDERNSTVPGLDPDGNLGYELPRIAVAHASRPADLWTVPEGVSVVRLRDSCTGEGSRLRTDVAVYRDEKRLFFLFSMDDDGIVASQYERDAELWREDVVEIFLAPDRLDSYYELEVSPVGTLFDAHVTFPGENRETMTVDTAWDCLEMYAAVRRVISNEGETTEILVSIPFGCLSGHTPSSGETWRANFYRIDRSPVGNSFDAWSPTRTSRPDFHVPARFGTLGF